MSNAVNRRQALLTILGAALFAAFVFVVSELLIHEVAQPQETPITSTNAPSEAPAVRARSHSQNNDRALIAELQERAAKQSAAPAISDTPQVHKQAAVDAALEQHALSQPTKAKLTAEQRQRLIAIITDVKERERAYSQTTVDLIDEHSKTIAAYEDLVPTAISDIQVDVVVVPDLEKEQLAAIRQAAQSRRSSLAAINTQIAVDFEADIANVHGDTPDLIAAKDQALIEPNYVYELFQTPNDPYFADQWSLDAVLKGQALPASDNTQNKIIVAVIDTGVDHTHEDLQGQLWMSDTCLDEFGTPIPGGCPHGGYDFVDDDNDPYPDDGHSHGTSVAGLIAAKANNGAGIASIANNTIQVMSLRACCTEQGFFEAQTIANAIYFAVQNGAAIINMSFGGPTASQSIKTAIEYANDNGVLVVAAAGNYASDNDMAPTYPANFDVPNMISVAATNSTNQLAAFSNYGQATVDIALPGQAVFSLKNNNSYGPVSGTSFAAPIASALLALFLHR